MTRTKIAVCIPTIPPRRPILHRAIDSVLEQTFPASLISVSIDHEHRGAGETRQRALMAVDPIIYPWVAFLDDDDEFLPEHLEKLLNFAQETDADYVYSWFKIVSSSGKIFEHDTVFPSTHYTEPFDINHPRQTTITVLVKTELARAVGFCDVELHANEARFIDGQRWGEDYTFTLGCIEAGARIEHLVDKTWLWHHDSNNTSGQPSKW